MSAKKIKLHVFARKRNVKNVVVAYIDALGMHTVMLTGLVLFGKGYIPSLVNI